MIPVYSPSLTEHSLRYAHEALSSGWVSSVGRFTDMAEAELAKRIGVRHAILVCNGTVAGHLMVRCIKRRYPHISRFIVPNNVFVAAWNAILYEYPMSSLVPLDANASTWNADYLSDPLLESANAEDVCFMVVHNLGNTVNVPAVKERYTKALVCEDACESVFGSYEGSPAGTASFMSTLSFFGNKNVTCGEGGAVLTNCDESAAAVRLMKGQGQSDTRYLHSEIGYNYRMTNLHAAVLLGQLERWDELCERKARLFNTYRERLCGVPNLLFQQPEPNTLPSNWMFGVRIRGLPSYAAAAAVFAEQAIETRPLFFPITRHGHLRHVACSSSTAALLHQECVVLPSWPDLSEAQIDRIVRVTEDVARAVEAGVIGCPA
jgi:perosamine synthetase